MQLLKTLRDRIDTSNADSDGSTIPPSHVYELLSNERRRYIIDYLADFDAGTEVSCSDIADYLAESLGGDRNSAYVSIIQQHGVRLDSCSVVTYNERAKTFTVRSELHDVHDAHKAVEDALE